LFQQANSSNTKLKKVCELYCRRWRIKDAFLITKRLLGLPYLWVGDTNRVQIQIFAIWIFYPVLNNLCGQVALALNQPIERIWVEMVFRSLYHFARAGKRGETTDIISYLVSKYKLFELVKVDCKRHRETNDRTLLIWASTS
jgi:hypothetical protein